VVFSPFSSRLFRRLLYVGVFFLILVTVAWFARGPILRTFANLWVIDELPVPADAVVVLGGGLNTRTFAAAEFYHQQLAPKILIPRVIKSPVEELGLLPSHTDLNRNVLLAKEVPPEAIELFGKDVSSTWESIDKFKSSKRNKTR
jgi:uncharacterized SAM-binding protein YcdF (DUF218 family)